jgi:hypothetical protein
MGAAGDEKAAAAAGAGAAGAEGEGAVDSKDLQQQSKALDKLTDHVEDRQLDSSRVQSVRLIPPPRTHRFLLSVSSLVL